MKKLVTLVIAIALVLSLGTLAAAEGPVKAYAVTVMSGGAAWGRFEDGFMEACEELGWEGHYLAPSTANDYTAMVQLTETALNDGADVLAVCVSDTGLFQEVLQRAKDAGVTLIGAAAGPINECYGQHNPHVRFNENALPMSCAIYASVAMNWLDDNAK